VLTIVGNNKSFSDTIQNCSANPYRRVDLTATISNNVDHRHAIDLLKERLQSKWIAENVGIEPDVEVEHDPEAVRQGKIRNWRRQSSS
jgi:small conductance mechanosensitive channel